MPKTDEQIYAEMEAQHLAAVAAYKAEQRAMEVAAALDPPPEPVRPNLFGYQKVRFDIDTGNARDFGVISFDRCVA